MADAEGKAPIIVIRKRGGGHGGGHHGGAWKVAFADFMTALMCFFLVMWLMSVDEETKKAIENYFNNPDTPFVAGTDPDTLKVRALGQSVADGENVMNGREGQSPDDMVERPLKPYPRQMAENEELSETARQLVEGEIEGMDASVEYLRFSIPAHLVFVSGGVELAPESKKTLKKIGNFIRDYKGHVGVQSYSDEHKTPSGRSADPYEFNMARSAAVSEALIEQRYIPEERIHPLSSGAARGRELASSGEAAGEDPRKSRRIEFTLSMKPLN